MIGARGIDDGFGLACAARQDRRFIQTAEDWFDPALLQETSLLFRPDQSQDFMA